MLSSLTVASSIISIITSYIIIDHNLIISLCLLVIFFMTFMLTLVLYLKPKVLVNQGGPSECANDDHQRGESQPETASPDTSSCEQSMPSLQHLPPRQQPQQEQYKELMYMHQQHHQEQQQFQHETLNHLLKPQGHELFFDRDLLEQDFKRQFYLHLWRMKAAKVSFAQSLNLEPDEYLESRNAYKTLLGTPSPTSRSTGDTNAIHHYRQQEGEAKSAQLSVPSHQSINNFRLPHSASLQRF